LAVRTKKRPPRPTPDSLWLRRCIAAAGYPRRGPSSRPQDPWRNVWRCRHWPRMSRRFRAASQTSRRASADTRGTSGRDDP
jgi:hypothetical protein